MSDFRQEFIEFAVARGVLRFGEFKTKAGACRPISSTPACSTTAHRWAARAILRKADARRGHRLRHAVRARLQGHPARRRHGHGLADGRNVPSLQPQGGQGSRRGRHAGRRAARGPRADRRRRHFRRHLGARVGRDDPRRGARSPAGVVIALDRHGARRRARSRRCRKCASSSAFPSSASPRSPTCGISSAVAPTIWHSIATRWSATGRDYGVNP